MGKGENNGYFRNCCSQRLESCWMQTTNRSMKVCNLLWSRSFLDLDSRSFEYKKQNFMRKSLCRMLIMASMLTNTQNYVTEKLKTCMVLCLAVGSVENLVCQCDVYCKSFQGDKHDLDH